MTIDELIESHLFGTDAAKRSYSQMTPGEPNFGIPDKHLFHSREGECPPKPKTLKAFKKKRTEKDEDFLGMDIDSRLMGSAKASGGLGSSISISDEKCR